MAEKKETCVACNGKGEVTLMDSKGRFNTFKCIWCLGTGQRTIQTKD
jgi:DnaJ-class molecular chaperone